MPAAGAPGSGVGGHHVVAAAALLPGLVGFADHDLAGGREQGLGLPHGHPAGVAEHARPGAREAFVALDCQAHEQADAGGAGDERGDEHQVEVGDGLEALRRGGMHHLGLDRRYRDECDRGDEGDGGCRSQHDAVGGPGLGSERQRDRRRGGAGEHPARVVGGDAECHCDRT